jgi:hypothetical protein
MTRALATALTIAAMTAFGCGGDDETTTSAPPATTSAGASDAEQTAGGASYDITAGEFIDASLPDEVEAVKDFVDDNPDLCGDVSAEGGGDFQVGVAIQAASVSPDTPLSEIVSQECQEEG